MVSNTGGAEIWNSLGEHEISDPLIPKIMSIHNERNTLSKDVDTALKPLIIQSSL
jgi:hypothetical protein